MRKFMRNNFSAFVLSFVLVMSFVSSSNAADITLSSAVVINSSNKSQYEGKSVAGTIPSDSSAGAIGTFISQGAIVVDGIELNLTIDGLNADYSEKYSMLSGISLVNGATLHLTVNGENTLTAGFGGAGIAVPDGCTLEITSSSTGTLNATGGKNYGGGAGIGSIGDRMDTQTQANGIYPQGLGNITINGGTINAQGGTWHVQNTAAGGAAGIGSSEYSGCSTNDNAWGDTTYINKITGSITINGGTVNATGGYDAAGIGGGSHGTLKTISITGGTVTATTGMGTSLHNAAAIGLGFNGFSSGRGTLTCPEIKISGGNVTANGNIGYGDALYAEQNIGGSITIDGDLTVNNAELSAGTVNTDNWKHSVSFEANGGTGSMETQIVQHGASYSIPECAFTPPNGKYFVNWTINGKSYAPGNSVTVNSKITVKAQWEGYAVITFDSNGGGGQMQSVSVRKRTSYTLPACTFTPPEGKFFSYWIRQGGNDYYSCYPGKSAYIQNNTTFRANWASTTVWSNETIVVASDISISDRVTVTGNVVLEILKDVTLTIPKGINVAEGNTLTIQGEGTLLIDRGNDSSVEANNAGIGGDNGQNCGTVIIEGGIINVSGRTTGPNSGGACIGGGNNGACGTITINGGELTATITTGQIVAIGGTQGTININGGKVTATSTISNGIKSSTINLGYSRPGDYIQSNSYTGINSKTGVVQSFFPAYNGNVTFTKEFKLAGTDTIATIENIAVQGSKTGANTVKLVPAMDTVTVTFNSNGGSEIAAQTIFKDEKAEKPTAPTRTDYYFRGWYLNENLSGTAYDFNTAVTGNITLYAKWADHSIWGKTDSYIPDGSESNPYVISTLDGWNLLADELTNGNDYSGKIFRLDENLTVTAMLGTSETGFSGTFEGNGKTLTVNYDSDLEYSAPFVYVNGGTIKDLTVTGTIKTSGQHIGGIIGQSSGNTAIEACNFVGKLLTTNTDITIGGGFVAENNGTLTISDSLYAPATLSDGETEPSATGTTTFSRNTESHTSEIMNSYYTRKLGTEQGKQGYTVTAETRITVALAEGSTNGLSFDGTIYAGSNETVSLTISGGNTKEAYAFKGYKASTGTLTESGGKYSLTMPEGNVTISAEFVETISYIDADGQNATTSDYTVLTSSMTSLTAGTYVVKENVTLSALTLTGDVNLILCDGATLSVTGNVSGANSLVVYGQDSGTGTLTAANITLTDNKNLSVYGGNLTAGTISVAGTVTVKCATVNNETYDANGYRTTSYTVTFDSNGGSAIDSQTLKFKYGEIVKATKPADPTRDNYGFVEWQLNGTAYDFGTAVTGDMTLTAKWTATEYTITYNGTDEATFTTANPTKYTVETETFTLNNPTKNGSTFAGWTGTGLSGATMTVTITKGLTGNREYTATWRKTGGKSQEDDPAKPTFRSHSLILEGEIGVNFYMNLPSLSGVDYEDHDKCYMEFDINGDKSNALKYKDANISYTENGKTYYGFRCYISSVQMAETITAVLHYGDNLTVSQDYSVQEYLDAILDGDFSGAAKDLMIAIQNYGYYAQQMLSKANNWTIGDKYAAMERASQSDYGATEISRAKEGTAQYAISRDVGNSQIQEVQYSLLLDSKTTVNVYLEVKEGYTGTVTATLDGGTANVATKLSSREYFVQIRDIPAHELSTIHTIGVTAGESFTVKVAALSYVYTVLNSTAEKIGEVDITTMRNGVTALYEYYDAAMTYAGRN